MSPSVGVTAGEESCLIDVIGDGRAVRQRDRLCPQRLNCDGRASIGSSEARDFDQTIAPYQNDEIDPLPPGREEKPLPRVSFVRDAVTDYTFPSSGRANAVLLLRENGTVARVLVPCASSTKLVDPIIASLSKAKLDPATRRGVPVKSMVVVPVAFDN